MDYKKIFWGFIFLFDFRIGGIDILPDIVGFLLIYIGLSALSEVSENYRNARSFALPMIFISIFDLYQRPAEGIFVGGTGSGILALLLGLVIGIMTILIVRGICLGIREQAEGSGLFDLAEKARKRLTLYLVVTIIITAGVLVPFLVGALFIPLILLSLVSYILILGLIKQAENEIWIHSFGSPDKDNPIRRDI